MAKDLEISRLCDAYGALLTENMVYAIRQYYDYDMSLAEIGEELGITRQAVLCRLKQAEEKLREYEQAIGLVKLVDRISDRLAALKDSVDSDTKQQLDKILSEL